MRWHGLRAPITVGVIACARVRSQPAQPSFHSGLVVVATRSNDRVAFPHRAQSITATQTRDNDQPNPPGQPLTVYRVCAKELLFSEHCAKDVMAEPLRVLIVEDSLEDAFLIVRELSGGGFEVISERVASAVAMQVALDVHPWDLIISDYTIPGFGGPAALALYQQKDLDIPFIIVSGVVGEALAVEMVKAGAHNYVMKDQLGRLVPAVRQELRSVQERRLRKQAEISAAYIASLVESCDYAIIGTTLDGTVLSWNIGAERLFGYPADDVVGHSVAMLVPGYRPENLSEILQRIGEDGHVESFDTALLRKNGTPLEVLLSVSPVKDANGRVIGASTVAQDITRRRLDENERLALIQDLTAALAHMGNPGVQTTGKH
jgi:PAS domain S-box-containing protein